MGYVCQTTSIEGFVQLIACNYLPHGYWFYVTGQVPADKDPRAVDAKLIEKYGIDISRSARTRRKRLGLANLRHLRYERFFVLLATHGKHHFFEEEAGSIRDIRRIPLKFAGYSISYRCGGRTGQGKSDSNWHSHVRIEQRRYSELKSWFLDQATRRSAQSLAIEFYRLPFEPYAPVRRQLVKLLQAVNAARKRAGCRPLPYEVLPLRRRVVRPFEPIAA